MNTSGSVTIEDGNPGQPGDFNPRRKVTVTIAFTSEDGDGADGQAYLDRAADAANKKVNELLGRSATQPATATTVASETPARTTRKKKDEPATEATIDASPAGSDKAKLEAAAGLTVTGAGVVAKVDPVVETDSLDDLLGEAAPVPITDAELAKAAQNKNAQMKTSDPNFSVKIRALVVEYAGAPPKKITDVPTAKRQEFLDKLRDLK